MEEAIRVFGPCDAIAMLSIALNSVADDYNPLSDEHGTEARGDKFRQMQSIEHDLDAVNSTYAGREL